MKLTIGKKLLGGFLLVSLMTLCLGIFAIHRMGSMNEVTVDIGTNWMPSIHRVGLMRAKLNHIRTLEMRYLLETGEAARAETLSQFGDELGVMKAEQGKYESLISSPEEQNIYDEFKGSMSSYIKHHEQMVTLSKTQKIPEAQALLLGEGKKIFATADADLERLSKTSVEGGTSGVTKSEDVYNSARLMAMILLFCAIGLSIGIGVWLSRSISARITEVAQRAEMLRSVCITGLGQSIEAMSNGDLNVKIEAKTKLLEITSQDELGAMAESLNGIIKQTQATIITFTNAQSTLTRLLIEDAGSTLEAAAQQDLTRRVNNNYQGVYNDLKVNINTVLDSLDESLSQVAASAEQVSSASSQISSGSESLAQGTSEQASSIEEISSSLQQMSSMAKQNVGNAKEARSLAEGARAAAERGTANMQNLSAAINKIKASADSTARIVKTIDEIAFQTNLLALNAAVEAARAGDAGKGFAVVAEEVRNLAMRSAESAKNTAELIEGSVKNSESGVTLNEGVALNLKEINEQVQKMSEMMAEIAAASEQQNQGVDQINSAVEQMNQATQQAAANAEQSASASQQLTGQAEEMMTMVSTFKLTNGGNNNNNNSSRRPATTAASASSRPRQQVARKQLTAVSAGRHGKPATGGARRVNGNGQSTQVDGKALIPFNDFEDSGVMNEF